MSEVKKGPLAGVRVLEITKVWAGPYAGKLLAFLGADVIKVESNSNLDEMRAYGGVDINSAPYFLAINQEVKSVQLNMKSPEGLTLLKDMISTCDILLDNLRPGAMEKLGLSYPEVKTVKPDIIQVSIKMWGNDGPFGYQTGYAPCFAALSGLSNLVGHDGAAPKGMNIRYGDSTVGASAAYAAIAALHHRESTGEGQFVDVSAVEALTSMVGDQLFAYGETGIVPTADQNSHSEYAPHGAYPCAGQDWMSLAIANDDEWARLCGALDAQRLQHDPRFSSHALRMENATALDAAIAFLTQGFAADELAAMLQQANLAAFKSLNSLDLISNDYYWASGAYRMVTDSAGKARPIIGPGWRMEPDEAPIEKGPPMLGEHNDYVYRELLGISGEAMDDLMARKIID